MKNKRFNRFLAGTLTAAMLLSVGGAAVAQGDKSSETIYVLLDALGAKKEIIVKTGDVERKDVQGELPFTVKLTYRLNDKETELPQMLGQSGNVKLRVEIASNSKTKAYYKENLALQMQLPIDTKTCSGVTAPGLTGVTVGTMKTLSGIVLPGKSAAYEIAYETTGFEAQAINFVCMPFDMSGMVDFDVSAIEPEVKKLQDGIGQYVDGVAQLSGGLHEINGGLKTLAANGKKLSQGVEQASAGAAALLEAMLGAMPPEQQQMFAPQLQAVQAGQKQLSDNLKAYTGGVSKAAKGLETLSTGAESLVQSGTALKTGIGEAIAPLGAIPQLKPTATAPESFLLTSTVSDIQFVMKTDALKMDTVKTDVKPAEKAKETFWDRLLALFGR